MIPYPEIDPVLIEIGPLKLRWYGLMYVIGFVAAYFLISREKRAKALGLQGTLLQDLFFFLAVGLIAGARLGYILFYQFPNMGEYLSRPLEIIAVWHGGMSFHGGLIGAILAGVIFCRTRGMPLWQVADCVISAAPIGLGLGRVGNFINGELFGRPSTLPWAMVFPGGGPIPRHPSQIYEALLEGVVLFVILWRAKERPWRPGYMVCLFLACYGTLRFAAEFFREPDPQVGLLWWRLSMGQWLCVAMVAGAALLLVALRRQSRAK